MSIRRGVPWGEHGPLPDGAPVVTSDAELRTLVEAARREGAPLPFVGLLGGDLCRTLGGRGDEHRLRTDEAMHLLVDVVRVELGGRAHWFVAHLVAATATWAYATLAMNAQWRGRWDVAPAAHPGDGLIDVLEAALAPAQRLEALRRLPTGTHVPHPDITVRRVEAVELRWSRARRVVLDGVPVGRAREARLEVEPAALTVVV